MLYQHENIKSKIKTENDYGKKKGALVTANVEVINGGSTKVCVKLIKIILK